VGEGLLVVVEALLFSVEHAADIDNNVAFVELGRVTAAHNLGVDVLGQLFEEEAGENLVTVEGAVVGADLAAGKLWLLCGTGHQGREKTLEHFFVDL